MKALAKLLFMLTMMLVLFQCQKDEEVTPGQPVDDKNPGNRTDTLQVVSDTTGADNFSIVGEKSNETATGYDVKGSLYLRTDSGKVAIVKEAEFTVTNGASGNLKSMEGSGPLAMPDFGMFRSFSLSEAANASFEYNTGKYFKDNNDDFKELPLRDTSYYFFFNVLNLAPGQEETMSVKNAKIGVSSFFVNIPKEEIVIATGSFEINAPSGSISVGNDLAIGISAKRAFQFTPQSYADSALNAIIDKQKAFSEMSGFLYLAGEMSLGDEIPMKISGNAVIDGEMNDIFSSGFASANFSFAMNGSLLFGHDLLDLIPLDFDTKLTNVTFRLDDGATGGKRHSEFRFAGDFDDNAWMETIVNAIAGTDIAQYIPFTGNEGSMFASFGDDWEFYVNTYFAINTPYLGKQKTRKGTLHIDADQLEVTGGLAIPFVPGEVAASGVFGYDGNIHLKAKANSKIDVNGVKLNSNLDFDIYNDAATLAGNIDIPYGIGKVDVSGKVDSKGLSFSGHVGNNRDVDFGNNVKVPLGALDISANLSDTNPKFTVSGKMFLSQFESPLVDVSGTIDTQGMELNGTISSPLVVQKFSTTSTKLPTVNMSLTAKTWQGVYFNGMANVPHGIGYFKVSGQITGDKKDKNGIPEILLKGTASGNPSLKLKEMTLPTAYLIFTISSVDGIAFDGNIKLPNTFGWVIVSGKLNDDDVTFTGKLGNHLTLGGHYLKTDLTMERKPASERKYPFSWKGTIYTPAGLNLSCFGHILNDGRVFTFGRINFDLNHTIDLPDIPGVPDKVGVNLKGNVTIEFGIDTWVYADASGCAGDKCVNFDRIFVTKHWDAASDLTLCFPLGKIIGVLPDYCVNISDL